MATCGGSIISYGIPTKVVLRSTLYLMCVSSIYRAVAETP